MGIPSQLLMLLRAMGFSQLLPEEDWAEPGTAIIHREQSQNLCLPTLSRKEDTQFCKTPHVDPFGLLWWVVCVYAQSLSCVWLCDPFTHQAPLSMEYSRQEYWSGFPFPTPEDLSNAGIESMSLVSPAPAGRFFTTVPPGKPLMCC